MKPFRELGLGDVFVAHGRVYEMIDSDRSQWLVGPRPRIGADFDPWDIVEPLDLVVTHDPPPIPDRSYDWRIHLDDYDGAPDAGPQPVGYGANRRAALVAFAQEFEDIAALRRDLKNKSTG